MKALLLSLKQRSDVEEYQQQFEELLNQVPVRGDGNIKHDGNA